MTQLGLWIIANAVGSHQIVARGLLNELAEMQARCAPARPNGRVTPKGTRPGPKKHRRR